MSGSIVDLKEGLYNMFILVYRLYSKAVLTTLCQDSGSQDSWNISTDTPTWVRNTSWVRYTELGMNKNSYLSVVGKGPVRNIA